MLNSIGELQRRLRSGSPPLSYLQAKAAMAKAVSALILLFFMAFHYVAAQNGSTAAPGGVNFHVGVILDTETLVGNKSLTSIALAVEDFYAAHPSYRTRLSLHVRNASGDDVRAASAALDLLENDNVQAIIGPQKSSQAVFVSQLGNTSHVPVVSFSATSPSLSHSSLPYFVRATLNDSAQVNSISSLMKFYGWREAVPIYEDTDYGRGIIPYLVDALQGIDARVSYRSEISRTATGDQIISELYKIMTMQTRVFIVHMNLNLASLLFTKAKEAGMMTKGYAWILTDGLSNLIDSMSPSVLEAMDGALGVQFYVPESAELDKFTIRWNKRFEIDYPNDPPSKLNLFALWGYDVIWAVAIAAEKIGASNNASVQNPNVQTGSTSLDRLGTSANGPELLKAISQNKFRGLSGYFDLSDRQMQASTFRIINVVGKQWKEVGFWTAQNGISLQPNHVMWPGESTDTPKGWEVPVRGKKLQVGVHSSGYQEFMKTSKDPITGVIKATGLSIDVFEEVVKRLPYALPYEYLIYDNAHDTSRSYDDFVYQVYLKNYDVAIGDITIRYNRSFYVDFTLPYTESGVAMVVPAKASETKDTWIFAKPLSKGMWLGSIALFIATGFVVWVLEFLGGNEKLGNSHQERLVIMLFFSLFQQKDKVKGFLSRIVLLVWLFFLLVLTSSYTASLASMLTVQQLQPTVTDVHELIKNKEYVGYHRGSYVKGLLEEIGFDSSKIKPYDSPEDFHNALSSGSKNGGISALVHEVPYIKLFLAKHCKEYIMVRPIYKTAGFGYAFPKGSPLLGDISKAILNITGGDTIIQIEKKWNVDENICETTGLANDSSSLTFDSFRGLFILTGGVSGCSLYIGLAIYLIKRRMRLNNQNRGKHQDGDGAGGQYQNENDQNQQVEGMHQKGFGGGICQQDDQGSRCLEIDGQHGEARDIEHDDEIVEVQPVQRDNMSAQAHPSWVLTLGSGSGSGSENAPNRSILKHRGSGSSNHHRAKTMIY